MLRQSPLTTVDNVSFYRLFLIVLIVALGSGVSAIGLAEDFAMVQQLVGLR